MKTLTALAGGAAGAAAVTVIHETVRRSVRNAPRMDLLGMKAISKGLHAAGYSAPGRDRLFFWAMAGDVLSNALYYSLVGIGKEKNIWVRASLLGLSAGIGAVMLPEPMHLPKRHSNKTTATQLMTVGLYVTGALVTTVVMKLMKKKKQRRNEVWEQRLVTSAMG